MAQLKEAFSVFDTDKSGTLTRSELKAILSRGPNPLLSDDEVEEVIGAFDENGDGELSIHEFAKACESMSDAEGEALQAKLDTHVINEAFEIFDADEDGKLGRADLSGILMRQEWDKPETLHMPMLSDGEIGEVLEQFGSGGSLDLQQFTNAVMTLEDEEAEALKKRMTEVVNRRAKLRRMGANRPVTVTSHVDSAESASAASRLHVLIVTLDYDPDKGPSGYEPKSSSLSCSYDALRMTSLAKRCGCADVVPLVDVSASSLSSTASKLGLESFEAGGHPSVSVIKQAWREMGERCNSGDTLLFFYSGHGSYYTNDLSGDELDGKDEILCCTEPDGGKCYLKDDTLSELVAAMPAGVRVLTVVDACHSGTPTDLDTCDYGPRQVMHLGAVSDTQVASDVGSGGALTGAILETIGTIVGMKNAGVEIPPPSVSDIYNGCVGRYGQSMEKKNQNMCIGKTKQTDPATFP